LPISGRSLLLYQFTWMVMKLTAVIIEEYHCYKLHTKFYPTPSLKVKSIGRGNYWGSLMRVLTYLINYLSVFFFCICQILEKKWEYNETVFFFFYFFLFGLWDYRHCGHFWPIVPASGDNEDDCGEHDGM
jgi:hypothetical protein